MADIRIELYAHHLWANERILDVCEPLADADLDAVVSGVYGSIRQTLVHICAAEARYVAGLKDLPRPEDPHEDKPFPGFAALRSFARTTGEELIALARSVAPDAVREAVHEGKAQQLPKSILLAQTINHGTEHRTNITTIMAARNLDPPQIDLWQYLRERSG